MPRKTEDTCFEVDLTKNPKISLSCPYDYSIYAIVPADFDDKLGKPIDWRVDDENKTEIEWNGTSRCLPFHTLAVPYYNKFSIVPRLNQLCAAIYADSVIDLSALSHIQNVKVFRYDFRIDHARAARLLAGGYSRFFAYNLVRGDEAW